MINESHLTDSLSLSVELIMVTKDFGMHKEDKDVQFSIGFTAYFHRNVRDINFQINSQTYFLVIL